jgi:EAL domain-containing protein (putative c-di-GMP-specific phosphodiesterase class I)
MKDCQACSETAERLDFTMAFQPIVDAHAGRVWGYEALVRGPKGEGSMSVLSKVTEANRYRFDQDCRVKALELAGRLFPKGGGEKLSINFMPNAVYDPYACIRATLIAANRVGFPLENVMFEFTEDERISDTKHIERIIAAYRELGFMIALDDFGAGYAGLNLLASFRTDLIKLDMGLVRGIESSPAKQAIMAALVGLGRELDIQLLAEGVETEAELTFLRMAGIRLVQGYLFAKPAVEALPFVEGLDLLRAAS